MPIGARLVRHAAAAGDRPALSSRRVRLSCAELEQQVTRRADSLAPWLARQGCVALRLCSGPALVIWFLAACRRDRPALILDPRWPEAQLEAAVRRAPPAVVVTASGPERPPADQRGAADRPWTAAVGDPDQRPFLIGFTSGTTGTPKGYLRSHASWLKSFDAWSGVVPTGPDDVVLVPGRLQSSLFLFAALHGLHAGARVHLVNPTNQDAVGAAVDAERPTVVHLVPAMLAGLLRRVESNTALRRRAVASLRAVVCAGSPLRPALRRRLTRLLPGVRPVEYYGSSELSFVGWRDARPGCSGFQLMPDVTVELRGREGAITSPGEVGTIHVKSPYLFTGYLPPAAHTGPPGRGDREDHRDPAGFVTIGDQGRWCPDGTLEVVGRPGEILHCAGTTVAAAEVEAALRAAPGIRDVMVVGLPHPRLGQLPAALVVVDRDVPSRGLLRRYAGDRLPPAHRPRAWYVVSTLPAADDRAAARARLARRLRSGQLDAVTLR